MDVNLRLLSVACFHLQVISPRGARCVCVKTHYRFLSALTSVPLSSVSLQKWQCLEDATGKMRLYKCKGMASMSAARKDGPANIKSKYYPQREAERNTEHGGCNCDQYPSFRLSTLNKKKLLSKKSKWSGKNVFLSHSYTNTLVTHTKFCFTKCSSLNLA